jgi:hypothetical protein
VTDHDDPDKRITDRERQHAEVSERGDGELIKTLVVAGVAQRRRATVTVHSPAMPSAARIRQQIFQESSKASAAPYP